MDKDKTHAPPVTEVGSARLVDMVAFRLRLAQAASFQAFADRAAEPGLRPARYAILQLIADHPGIGQTGLSKAVGRDKTTLTPTLADLERRGLILRARDPNDGRARCLSLTAAGQDMLNRLARHARDHDATVDAILGPDREVLLKLLSRLIDGLDTGTGPEPKTETESGDQ